MSTVPQSEEETQMKTKMKKFYVTFGQKSPFRNGWVEVEAVDDNFAQRAVENAIGRTGYSRLYDESEFQPEHFILGKIGETIVGEM